MFEITRIKTTIKPEKVESLGNGIWYYNYDIQESTEPGQGQDETVYNFVQVRISGTPDYDKCVKAIIRAYIDQHEEFNLINNYNAYQLGLNVSNENYKEYLQLVKSIKEKVAEDFSVSYSTSDTVDPRISDIFSFVSTIINTMSLTDSQALSIKTLYPNWEDLIGQTVKVDDKMQYSSRLWKVIQEHTVQADWTPTETPSLFTEITEDHEGTIDDPIPYNNNMELEQGKYYIQDQQVYLCTRSTGQPVYNDLKDLVNIYVVEIYNE